MSKYVRMLMGTRQEFDNVVKKDGLEEASVYINRDTGELYFVCEDKEPISLYYDGKFLQCRTLIRGAPPIGRISLTLQNFDLKNCQEGF